MSSSPYKKPSKNWNVYETHLGIHSDTANRLRGCFCSTKLLSNTKVDEFVKEYIYEIFSSKGTDEKYKNHCFYIFKKKFFNDSEVTICFLHETLCINKFGVYLSTQYFGYIQRLKSMKAFL